MEEKLLKVREVLKKYAQEQVLDFYDTLSKEKQNQLLDEVLTLNFEQLKRLYESTKTKPSYVDSKIEPIPYITKDQLTNKELEEYQKLGEEAIKQGKVAVVTMAGGQGTRLGHSGPKGTYDIGLASHQSIFELLCDRLKEAKEKYNVAIPWYLMTSDENNQDTIAFFEKNEYFHYPKESVHFFIQGKMPMIDMQGKILLDEEGMIKLAPDGHGGVFESMVNNGVIYQMKQQGIERVLITGVDNVLAKLVDPIFLGLQIKQNVIAASKSVVKAYADEKVGVFCKKDGKPNVIEYTEVPKELAEAKDETGGFLLGDSNIINHQFHIDLLEKISTQKLPYHIAFKKAKYKNKEGKIIEPKEPNAYKFETFLFDIFSFVPEMLVFRVKREEEFAPVKNATGKDSPETARELYKAYYHLD